VLSDCHPSEGASEKREPSHARADLEGVVVGLVGLRIHRPGVAGLAMGDTVISVESDSNDSQTTV
jgi:hypothetical protein